MSSDEGIEIAPQTIKELELLEAALSDVDTEIIAKQYLLTKDIFAQRQTTISKIPKFWAVVFNNAQIDLEAAITPADREIFEHALTGIDVVRPEIPASATVADTGLANYGEPRSVTLRFQFAENPWFTDSVLEKTLYYRYSKDGEAGLVSEPVKISWKAGKDVTEGLTDAAYAFWTAQKKLASQNLDGVVFGDARKARDAEAKKMPEYKAVVETLEEKVEGAISFFNFFSYRGRWTSAVESKEARAELAAKRQAALAGKPIDGDDKEEEEEDDDEEMPAEAEAETFPAGHEVAVTLAEDIWPGAIDYFMSETLDSDDELDGLDLDDDSEDDDDVEMS
ncbi:NAP domain-containing protein [Microdochium nivale]|nr:NAP domain-containing protein [Microdochium nivale]